MNKLYNTLQHINKTRPHFQPGLLVMKCPDFIVKAVLGNRGAKTGYYGVFWDKKAAATAGNSSSDKNQIQPKYQ